MSRQRQAENQGIQRLKVRWCMLVSSVLEIPSQASMVGITSLGAQGAGVLHLVPLLTSQIHYGMFDEAGKLDMRLSFDHRVLDGTTAARALKDMEVVLLGEIIDEYTLLST